MKLIRLILSDSAFEKALELAGSHAVPVEAYLSSEMEDLLDRKATIPNRQAAADFKAVANKPGPSPSSSSIMPDTLRQVLDVSAYVYRSGNVPHNKIRAKYEFRDAVRAVAKEWNIGETSVRDKCCTTRRLGLPDVPVNTDTFIVWLCEPERLRDHLCRKFPNCVTETHKRLAELLPGRFGANGGREPTLIERLV